MNKYLEFYEKYKISPVVQNIENFQKHIKRRTNLYRQLGVTPLSFKEKDILEIGPGGGYNAIVTYTYEPKTYTLVEPNTTGFNELKSNFEKINQGNVEFYNCMLEDFNSGKQYDIIMCEGLIPGLSNKEDFIEKVLKLLKPNGIFILTTADQISMFFEMIRKYMANILIEDCSSIEQKVKVLVDSFSTHLDTLDGMTRSHEDWCLDNLIGDAVYEHSFSINDAISLMRNEFHLLGSSPDLFSNYYWYKELPTDIVEYNQIFEEQFFGLWHTFLDYRCINQVRESDKNKELAQYCLDFINKIKSNQPKSEMVELLKKIRANLENDVKKITLDSLDEVIFTLQEDFNEESISKMKSFKSAFGRGQSYISFVKEV